MVAEFWPIELKSNISVAISPVLALKGSVGIMLLKRIRKYRHSTYVLMGMSILLLGLLNWQFQAEAKPIMGGKIIYDPSSGSYFEMVRLSSRAFRTWRHARAFAEKQFYKGIRGRLAVIKTRATHEFLQKNLGITIRYESWIGLRYHCSSKKLVWVTGDILKRGVDFEMWSNKLYYEGVNYCRAGYKALVVFYTVVGKHLYWRISGPAHGLNGAIIEYSTR